MARIEAMPNWFWANAWPWLAICCTTSVSHTFSPLSTRRETTTRLHCSAIALCPPGPERPAANDATTTTHPTPKAAPTAVRFIESLRRLELLPMCGRILAVSPRHHNAARIIPGCPRHHLIENQPHPAKI